MKRNLLKKEDETDPISAVSNLFDVAMVFAVALMVALVTRYNMTEMLSTEDFTMVKNPGKEKLFINIRKKTLMCYYLMSRKEVMKITLFQ